MLSGNITVQKHCAIMCCTVEMWKSLLWTHTHTERAHFHTLLIISNHHTVKKKDSTKSSNVIIYTWKLFASSQTYKMPLTAKVSAARVSVTLRELSVCRELRPALLSALLHTARLFPDACHRTTCSCLHDRSKHHPATRMNSGVHWAMSKCLCQWKCWEFPNGKKGKFGD